MYSISPLSNILQSKFEHLLKVYLSEKLNINTDLISKPIAGFEINHYTSANKMEFVSTLTKEIIFEVGCSWEGFTINTYYIEQWRKGA